LLLLLRCISLVESTPRDFWFIIIDYWWVAEAFSPVFFLRMASMFDPTVFCRL